MKEHELIPRVQRGIDIVKRGGVTKITQRYEPYEVLGDEGDTYKVRFYPDTGEWTCECPDHRERGMTCKHIFACIMFREVD